VERFAWLWPVAAQALLVAVGLTLLVGLVGAWGVLDRKPASLLKEQ